MISFLFFLNIQAVEGPAESLMKLEVLFRSKSKMITALLTSRIAIGSNIGHRDQFSLDYMSYLMYQRHYRVLLSYDLTTFQILGQKFVNFFWFFGKYIWHQKDILKSTDLYQLCPRPFSNCSSAKVLESSALLDLRAKFALHFRL